MVRFYCIAFGLFFCMAISAQKKITPEEYIETYKDLAISEMKRSGIPASITLAQGLLESANGNSRLATQANNHFGIKCHNDWDGKEIYHDDNRKDECFRHYNNAKDSYLDHTDFLMTRSRYAFLFEYKSTDYESWAKGLRKAGYATDPKYPQLLISLIERYNLHQYDTGVSVSKNTVSTPKTTTAKKSNSPSGKSSRPDTEFTVAIKGSVEIQENNRTRFVRAKQGDTYASLSKELDMMAWQLPKYNETLNVKPLQEGDVVYLQPKRRKAARGYNSHIVEIGETMYSISQQYGIKLKRLYIMNRMTEGTEPEIGQQLNLRKKK